MASTVCNLSIFKPGVWHRRDRKDWRVNKMLHRHRIHSLDKQLINQRIYKTINQKFNHSICSFYSINAPPPNKQSTSPTIKKKLNWILKSLSFYLLLLIKMMIIIITIMIIVIWNLRKIMTKTRNSLIYSTKSSENNPNININIPQDNNRCSIRDCTQTACSDPSPSNR